MEGAEARLILVVEDEDDVRDLAVAVLRDEGFSVMQAATGGIVLAILNEDLPIELLFTDIVMPDGPGGIELGEWTRSHRPDIKILYTTGFGSALRFNERIHGKMLPKPYRSKQLVQAVVQLLCGDEPCRRDATAVGGS
jgi:two-component system, cell cycle sensor histidine kinase and response regulator CckA